MSSSSPRATPATSDAILALNAGSSSIKFALYDCAADALDPAVRGQIERLNDAPHFIARNENGEAIADATWRADEDGAPDAAIERLIDWVEAHCAERHRLVAVGHRVVHGATQFTQPTKIDAAVLGQLEQLVPLAPLHQPQNLAPIRLLLQRAPELVQVACFDTAFHRSNPAVAQLFALPAELSDAGVRRYGFHGLSYEYIAAELPRFDARAAQGRTVVLHLGNGASMCALDQGHSVATTMGFSALDGLPMGTRCGALDPGVLLYLMDQRAMDARAIEDLLYHRSGLLGVSGISSDMRELLASDDERAQLAVELFVYRIGCELGALAAALGGLDAIVFTAGIGEHSAAIRQRVCAGAGWLGLEFDDEANRTGGPCISTSGSRVSAWVVPTDEEQVVARHVHALLGARAT